MTCSRMRPMEALAKLGIQGTAHGDPASGRARVRIDACDRATVRSARIATWDAAEYLILSIDAVVRRLARLFIDIDLTHWLVSKAAEDAPGLVAATVPKAVSWIELTDVLQRLVDEEIGIGDMQRILQALAVSDPELRELRDTHASGGTGAARPQWADHPEVRPRPSGAARPDARHRDRSPAGRRDQAHVLGPVLRPGPRAHARHPGRGPGVGQRRGARFGPGADPDRGPGGPTFHAQARRARVPLAACIVPAGPGARNSARHHR